MKSKLTLSLTTILSGALLGAASAAAPVQPGDICLPTVHGSASVTCSCEGNSCVAVHSVTPTSTPECGGCKFVYDVDVVCGSATCNYSDSGTVGLACRTHEKLSFPCPGDPDVNILVLIFECSACF